MAVSATVVLANVTVVDHYATSLINMLTGNDVRVNLLSNMNFEKQTQAPYERVSLPQNDIIEHHDLVNSYVLKELNASGLINFHRATRGKALFYVCKDGENRFDIDQPLPFLTFFCLTLNYDSIPPKTKQVIPYFKFVVATGRHCYDRLRSAFPDKNISLIYPPFLQIGFPAISTLDYRKMLNIRLDKYIFMLDINEYLELKSVDVIVKAYAELIQKDPAFKRDTLLIINAHPTVQLQNILKLEDFSPDNVNVYVPYYSSGYKSNPVMLEALLGSCNVIMHAVSGGDFDPHANLAQRLGKLVVYSDIDPNREYFPYGIKVKTVQPYFEGITQAFIRLPKIADVSKAMMSAYDARSRLVPGEKVKSTLDRFQKKHDRFESQWKDILSNIVIPRV